ncbi:hypothetical protein [Flavicella sediminum]|uniref:hypothetical protein n=1 Tax=Flavicella sediminum TaxID=2585141 RepID=UPI00112233B8|nr:hypothetical protein [Flavicella sediminum]
MKLKFIFLVSIFMFTNLLNAQSWESVVRGSWVEKGSLNTKSIALVDASKLVDIIVSSKEHSCVRQAAFFLAADIEKITGKKPKIRTKARKGKSAIHLSTYGAKNIPNEVNSKKLKVKWEAYIIKTVGSSVWLVGSNARGTAFAVYTFSERLGIDPLYHWTGYTPTKYPELSIKTVNLFVDEPTFKFRGMYHDDKDLIPSLINEKGYVAEDPKVADIDKESHIQKLESGYPEQCGTVDMVWWKRFFETALRLRMNQVAPYVREPRSFEVNKMASDWGCFSVHIIMTCFFLILGGMSVLA